MGVYPLHASNGILGPARRVSPFASQIQDSFVVADGPFIGKRILVEVEDNWHLPLEFGDGRIASVTANTVARDSRAPQMELFGLDGTISVNLLDVSAPVETLLLGEAISCWTWRWGHLVARRPISRTLAQAASSEQGSLGPRTSTIMPA